METPCFTRCEITCVISRKCCCSRRRHFCKLQKGWHLQRLAVPHCTRRLRRSVSSAESSQLEVVKLGWDARSDAMYPRVVTTRMSNVTTSSSIPSISPKDVSVSALESIKTHQIRRHSINQDIRNVNSITDNRSTTSRTMLLLSVDSKSDHNSHPVDYLIGMKRPFLQESRRTLASWPPSMLTSTRTKTTRATVQPRPKPSWHERHDVSALHRRSAGCAASYNI